MKTIFSGLALSAALLITACSEAIDSAPQEIADTPPATVVEAEPEVAPAAAPALEATGTAVIQKRATIDWAKAREDFTARDMPEDSMVIASGSGSAPVPVLLPEQNVGVASTGESALQFRPMADGYFAVQKGETYDLIINGTDRLIARTDANASASDTPLRFEETLTGAQVSFSRYGASYLVEFMCKDPGTAAKGSCVSEEDALTEVEKLLISGTR